MRLSTYIRAGRKADGRATDAAVKCLNASWDEPTRELAHRKWQQADKFFARAIALADALQAPTTKRAASTDGNLVNDWLNLNAGKVATESFAGAIVPTSPNPTA